MNPSRVTFHLLITLKCLGKEKKKKQFADLDVKIGELHLKPKLSMFCTPSQNFSTVLKSNIGILNQIVWETQKLY